jgi:SAM-dependent methyltransferase
MKADITISRELNKRKRFNDSIYNAEFERAKIAISLLPDVKFDRVLDVGCGYGVLLGMMNADERVGIDIVNNITRNVDNVIMCDINKGLPFRDRCFDVVTCIEVLEHTHYPHYVLSEIKRVLSDDGYVVIGLPNACNIYCRRDIVFGKPNNLYGWDSFAHNVFTSLGQNREFVESEFKVIKSEYTWIKDSRIARLIPRRLKAMIPELFAMNELMLCRKK